MVICYSTSNQTRIAISYLFISTHMYLFSNPISIDSEDTDPSSNLLFAVFYFQCLDFFFGGGVVFIDLKSLESSFGRGRLRLI